MIIIVLLGSSLLKAETIPDEEFNPDILSGLVPDSSSDSFSLYKPELFEETEDFNIGTDFLYVQRGMGSWYGKKFQNRKTANGERYNMYSLSAAHRRLPFNSIIRITDIETKKSILVRINDRGPYINNRIIDLSYQAMKEISANGCSDVKVEGLIVDDQNIIGLKPNHCFCYSLTYPLLCLPDSVLNVVDSSNDFDEAFKIYSKLSSECPDRKIYLSVISFESRLDSDQAASCKYFISEFISDEDGKRKSELTVK
jgi:rare lipoprotein A